VHEEEDVLGMWGPDIFKTSPLSALMQVSSSLILIPPSPLIGLLISGDEADIQLTAAFGAVGAFGYFIYRTRLERPVAARTYPFDGLTKELGGHVAARAEEVEEDE
jgi:NADH dehydrogenase (ubiquinone) 1 beta subcomplex subunit 8